MAGQVTLNVMGAPLFFGFSAAGGRGHLPSIDLVFLLLFFRFTLVINIILHTMQQEQSLVKLLYHVTKFIPVMFDISLQ